ncbi:MAG TPA: hypothetical protein VGO75_08200 [Gemmatimonadaceae bacterium]|nr:hypothetical protein [Gemmatimonadaceae bacterium]
MSHRAFLLGALLFGASCKAKPTEDLAPVPVQDLVLEVSNNNWSDVVIYMIQNGSRKRFTMVTAARSATVAIPSQFISSNGSVQIVAHRVGGTDEYVSPVVSVLLGRTIALTLESNLNRSTIGVW